MKVLLKFDTSEDEEEEEEEDEEEEEEEEFDANSENVAFVRSWFLTGVIIDNADMWDLPWITSSSLGVIV